MKGKEGERGRERKGGVEKSVREERIANIPPIFTNIAVSNVRPRPDPIKNSSVEFDSTL